MGKSIILGPVGFVRFFFRFLPDDLYENIHTIWYFRWIFGQYFFSTVRWKIYGKILSRKSFLGTFFLHDTEMCAKFILVFFWTICVHVLWSSSLFFFCSLSLPFFFIIQQTTTSTLDKFQHFFTSNKSCLFYVKHFKSSQQYNKLFCSA